MTESEVSESPAKPEPVEHGSPIGSLVASFVTYQLAWLACVLEPTSGFAGMGVLAVAIGTLVHLALFPNGAGLLRSAAAACLWGWLADALLMHMGVLVFAAPVVWGGLPPLWMATLWWNFGLLWSAALGWLSRRPREAMWFGLLGGPVAYYGGAALGAVTFGQPLPIALAAIALEWGLTMWVWCRLTGKPTRQS